MMHSPAITYIVSNLFNTWVETSIIFPYFNFLFRGGMKEFKGRVRLPCDDKKIRSSHEDHLLEALTFFESKTEDTTSTARWLYMEKLAVIK